MWFPQFHLDHWQLITHISPLPLPIQDLPKNIKEWNIQITHLAGLWFSFTTKLEDRIRFDSKIYSFIGFVCHTSDTLAAWFQEIDSL